MVVAGRNLRTTLGQRENRYEVEYHDQEVAARLRLRYGADLELHIIPDGGAGFADLQQAFADRVRPIAPPRAVSQKQAAISPASRPDQPSLFPWMLPVR